MYKDPVIVSYFTKGTLYEKEAEALRASCEKMGLEYRIEGIEPFGKWHEHTCYKPVFILQKMLELKRPLVWIDADAEIVQRPKFNIDCDIALRIYDIYPPDHPCYLFAGTIYLDYNQAAVQLVKDWAEACQSAIDRSEFAVDQQVLARHLVKANVCLKRLPNGYAAIFEEEMPEIERFIVHYQASRLYKKIVDGELSFGIFDSLSVKELRKLRPKTRQDSIDH